MSRKYNWIEYINVKYRKEIDGLRALAVVPVVLFHAGIASFSGGFIGVDVFFVISGYLITTIIVEELNQGKFSIASFYERRARRILPALVSVCLFCVPFAWLLMNKYEIGKFSEGLIGVSVFASNILFWMQDGYFNESSEFNPLIHTWSLAVEEQYYIFYPLLLMAVAYAMRKHLAVSIAVISLVSLIISIVAVDVMDNAKIESGAFFLLPARIWELGAGGLCALALREGKFDNFSAILQNSLGTLGLALVLVSIITYDSETAFPGVASIPPVIGTCLIICFTWSGTLLGRLMGWRVFVFIGILSYSIYLWHQPLLAFTRIFIDALTIPTGMMLAVLSASFVLSYLSWRFIERPFRNNHYLSRRTIFSLSAVSLIALFGFGVATKDASKGIEADLAAQLAGNDYVYSGNVDERLFMAERLRGKLDPAEIVVMGSSRLMLVSSVMLRKPILNMSVSGASVEDYVALGTDVAETVGANTVLLGADPWLFNAESGQNRWRSIADRYAVWAAQIDNPAAPVLTNVKQVDDKTVPMWIYEKVNFSSFVAKTDQNEHLAKRARDGSLIYSKKYTEYSEQKIRSNFPELAKYAMSSYKFSESAEKRYRSLIDHLKNKGLSVVLVMTPYHPELYALMTTERAEFEEVESRFRAIAAASNVDILGSYDPQKAGCGQNEFYDGMHPKAECMTTILAPLR